MRNLKKRDLLIPRIETEHSTWSHPSLCPLLGAEHNQCRAPGSAALNLCVFAAEIPPTHTLGLNASSAFGVDYHNLNSIRSPDET